MVEQRAPNLEEMVEQRAPNLEEMDEQEAHRFLTDLYSHLSFEEEYNLRHQEYVMEMPQYGERFRGRENMRAFQEAYLLDPLPSRRGAALWRSRAASSLPLDGVRVGGVEVERSCPLASITSLLAVGYVRLPARATF